MQTMFIQSDKSQGGRFNIENLLDKSPFILDADDSYDVFVFRRLLEASMKMGFWNGFVGQA